MASGDDSDVELIEDPAESRRTSGMGADELRAELRKRKAEFEQTLAAERGNTKRARKVKVECEKVMDGIAEEFVCDLPCVRLYLGPPSTRVEARPRDCVCAGPITQELPVVPVLAEDGKIYERAALEQWLARKKTSPSTGAQMGTRLVPTPQIRNAIEALVTSGKIDGEKAVAWRKALADEKQVKEWRAKAEKGDAEAMKRLAENYIRGACGLAKDLSQARAWYERSAALRDVAAMGMYGKMLLVGHGGPAMPSHGIVLLTEAATLGSDHAAYKLGKGYLRGLHGLPRDAQRARYFLKKAASGRMKIKQLSRRGKVALAGLIQELELG